MQKFFSLLLALIACAGTIFADGTKIGDLYYNLNAEDLTASVTYQELWSETNYSYLAAVNIPESVEYNSVTYSVTSIGWDAFIDCTGLTSVTIGNSVTSIGDYAFYGCSGLTSIEIPNSVTSIGQCAFEDCSGLTSITIPNSVTSIGDDAFSACSGLTSITIPNSVTSIGNYAFANCTGLTSVTIGNSVTSIGVWAFYSCSGLTSIVVASGNTTYDSRENCNAIIETSSNTLIVGCQNTIIPNSVTSIGDWAFYSCYGLTSIEIPNSVTSIGGSAFSWCTGMTSVTIGNSVTSIGEGAFNVCHGLTSVTNYAATPQTIESNVFDNVNKSSCTLYVPEGSIGLYQAAEVWKDFTNIQAIPGEQTIENPVLINGLYYNLYADNKTAEVTYQKQWSSTNYSYLTTVNIPESVEYNSVTYSVTSIGWGAFLYCSGLTSVTIGNSVTSIGDWAFGDCSGLTSIEIPNSVTSIGISAFRGCTGLTSVTIPNSVTSIGEWAFGDCSGLTSIEIPNSVTSIEGYAFYECSGLTSIEIPYSVTSIGERAFSWCSGLTSVTIPNSVTSIGGAAFSDCSGLTSIVVASGNTNYDSRENCNAIIETTSNTLIAGCQNTIIPNSVISIGERAFSWCSGLTSITIPNSVTSIGVEAFYGCTGLTSVTIPNSVTSIGGGAFDSCSGLTSVTIGNSVTSIGSNAFSSCYGLTSIEIPNSVTSIGDGAFSACFGLTSVTNYATTPQTIESNVFDYVHKSSCTLYVPEGSIGLYQAANGWKDFTNIQAIADEPEPITDYTVNYLDKDGGLISTQIVKLELPEPSVIAGFTFVKWIATSDNINDGITIQAVYEYNGVPSSAPEVYTNPANPAQKLIRNGNVYILTGDKTYTITGQQVK